MRPTEWSAVSNPGAGNQRFYNYVYMYYYANIHVHYAYLSVYGDTCQVASLKLLLLLSTVRKGLKGKLNAGNDHGPIS